MGDRAENIVALEAILSSQSDAGAGAVRGRRAQGTASRRVRRHTSRRPDARHGRTRDCCPYQATSQDSGRADHLPDGAEQRADFAFRSYSAGAVDYIAKPFVGAARQGFCVRGPVHEKPAGQRAGGAAALTARADAAAVPGCAATAEPLLAELGLLVNPVAAIGACRRGHQARWQGGAGRHSLQLPDHIPGIPSLA